MFHVGHFYKTQFVSLEQTKSVGNIFQEELDYYFLKLKYDVFFGVFLRGNPCIFLAKLKKQTYSNIFSFSFSVPSFFRPSFNHHVCTRDGIKLYVKDLSKSMARSHGSTATDPGDVVDALDRNSNVNANGAQHHCPPPTIFLFKEDFTDSESKELKNICTDDIGVEVKIVGENDTQNDGANAVIVHVRNICYGPGTGVKQSRLLKHPLHLVQVQH